MPRQLKSRAALLLQVTSACCRPKNQASVQPPPFQVLLHVQTVVWCPSGHRTAVCQVETVQKGLNRTRYPFRFTYVFSMKHFLIPVKSRGARRVASPQHAVSLYTALPGRAGRVGHVAEPQASLIARAGFWVSSLSHSHASSRCIRVPLRLIPASALRSVAELLIAARSGAVLPGLAISG